MAVILNSIEASGPISNGQMGVQVNPPCLWACCTCRAWWGGHLINELTTWTRTVSTLYFTLKLVQWPFTAKAVTKVTMSSLKGGGEVTMRQFENVFKGGTSVGRNIAPFLVCLPWLLPVDTHTVQLLLCPVHRVKSGGTQLSHQKKKKKLLKSAI